MKAEMEVKIEPGSLRTKWWQTKKLTEWEYHSAVPLDEKMVERFGKPVIHVNITNSRDGKYFFVARCDWFGDKESEREITAKDLDTLEKKVQQHLDDCVLAKSGIKWSDWLEVKVSYSIEAEGEKVFGKKARRDQSRSAEFRLDYSILKRAKLPDGRDMLLKNGWSMEPFPKAKAAGVEVPSRWNGGGDYYDNRDTDSEYAYIPATPEAIAALDLIADRTRELGKRIQGVLAQGSVMATLANLSRELPKLGLAK